MVKTKKTWEKLFNKVEVLGGGGNAEVYKVIRKNDNKEFALKELRYEKNEKNLEMRRKKDLKMK